MKAGIEINVQNADRWDDTIRFKAHFNNGLCASSLDM
jgi:hypothetical protein